MNTSISRQDVRIVTLVSGLCGLYLGLDSGWQLAIESAQVVAGIVEYPHDNPFGMYHLKTWTLLHQVPAALMACGISEQSLAIALGGLVGLISFPALALITFAVGGNRWLACAAPLLFLGARIDKEISSVYPVNILSEAPWLLYGCLGTALVLLIWSLIAVGHKPLGVFLMGLAPAVHPTLGAWCFGIGLLALLWSWRQREDSPRQWLPYLLAGLGITAISLMIHWQLVRTVPDIPAELKDQYVTAFAANWDPHRKPFPLDHLVVVMAGMSVVLSGWWLRFVAESLPATSRWLLRAILLSGVFSIVLCICTHFAEFLPRQLLMAMPGRFINVVGLAFPALALGMLSRQRANIVTSLIAAGLLVYLLLCVQRYELGWFYVPPASGLLVACSLSLLIPPGNRTQGTRRLMRYAAWPCLAGATWMVAGYALTLSLVIGAVAWRLPHRRAALAAAAISLSMLVGLLGVRAHKSQLKLADWRSNPVYAAAFRGQGILLTSPTVRAVQLRTRRPILLEAMALNQLPYVPESGPSMNHILQRVYGEDLFRPLPAGSEPGMAKQYESSREIWESRTAEEWTALAQEFGFTQIVTNTTWRLQLPVEAQAKSLLLYGIPAATVKPPAVAGGPAWR